MFDIFEPLQHHVTNHDPLISAIVTSYNKAHFLRECIESFLPQTYRNFEILVVNDGSTDDTSELCRALIKEYPTLRLRLVEKVNGGVSDARNYGVRLSSGRILMMLDGDDKIFPEYFAKGVRAFRETGADIFRPSQQNFGGESGTWTPAPYDRFRIRYDNCIPTPSLFDRRLFEEGGGFHVCLSYGEDWEHWVRLSKQNPKVALSPELLTYWRRTDDGLHTQLNEGRYEDQIALIIINNHELYPFGEVLKAHEYAAQSAPKNVERVRKLDSIHPHEWVSKFFLGLRAQAHGNWEEARECFSKALSLCSNQNWQVLFRYAELALHFNQRAEAKELFHEVRILRPDTAPLIQNYLQQIEESGLNPLV